MKTSPEKAKTMGEQKILRMEPPKHHDREVCAERLRHLEIIPSTYVDV
jgi:hypothetical protein